LKHASDGSIEKYKERFLAKEYSQVEGIDYEETFSPIERYSSIRSIPSLVAHIGWKIHQMDVKKTFLMELLRRMCMLSNHNASRLLIESLKCADSSECFTVSSKHPVLSTPRSITISLIWGSQKVKQMKTSIIFPYKVNY